MEKFSLSINRWLHYVGCVALAALMFLTVADVLGRYLLNSPVPGTFELTEVSMVFIVFLALGLAQHHGEHISIDLAYNYFPPWLRRGVDVFVDLVNLAIIGAITWQLYKFSLRMHGGHYTTAVLRLPLYPFVLIAVAGAATYTLAIISGCVKTIGKFRRE